MSNLNSRSTLTEFPALERRGRTESLKVTFSKFVWWRKSADADRFASIIIEDPDTCLITSVTDPFFLATRAYACNRGPGGYPATPGSRHVHSQAVHRHPFVLDKLTEPLDSDHVQGLVADFRRKGLRLPPPVFTDPTSEDGSIKDGDDSDTGSQFEVLGVSESGDVEALDPSKQQVFSVLFCSFSPSSCNFPTFCVNPWVVNSELYGRNDMSLGGFLRRFCFRKTYCCPSKTCDQPMIGAHVRRFVHDHGCVTLCLKELPMPVAGAAERILMWNWWCSKCETVSPIVPMSSEALSLSFAKYLALRFEGHQHWEQGPGNNNHCPHSLQHQNVQYFAQSSIVCSFKYSSIKLWEIGLPLTLISVTKELPDENLQATSPIVHETEPSSLVAFTLSSTDYQKKRMDLMKLSPQGPSSTPLPPKIVMLGDENESTGGKKPRLGDGCEDLSSSVGSQYSTISEDRVVNYDEGEDQDLLNSKSNAHIEVQFTSDTAKYFCRVYFAEKFRQFRKLCVAEGEEFYIRSISRCVPWAPLGGKSGSNFSKTNDDRFVIKEMSKYEIDSFLDIAPNYFKYMKSSFQDKKPTVLAKIVGVYRIGFKNLQNNTASKQDILVIENLFYQRSISQKFDLKGSIRNRLATAQGKVEDLVLLDENLVNMACESPLYVRPQAKAVLTDAITNDSKFLASQMVMDYSLLVGLDDEANELVVGIIDYIRTFTWDKKIEAFVKSSGILGGQGKTPTVISPDEYQVRFCEAMYRYFLPVPDRWKGMNLKGDP